MKQLNLTNVLKTKDDAAVANLLPDGVVMKGSWYNPKTLGFISRYLFEPNPKAPNIKGNMRNLRKVDNYEDAVSIMYGMLTQVYNIVLEQPKLTPELEKSWLDVHHQFLEACANEGKDTNTYTFETYFV